MGIAYPGIRTGRWLRPVRAGEDRNLHESATRAGLLTQVAPALLGSKGSQRGLDSSDDLGRLW